MGWRSGGRKRRHIDYRRIPIAGRNMTGHRPGKIVAGSGMSANNQVLLVVDMLL